MKKITAGCGTLFPTVSTPSSSFCRNVLGGAASTIDIVRLCSLMASSLQCWLTATSRAAPVQPHSLTLFFLSMMIGQHLRDDDRDALAGGYVQKFIGAMRVRVRTEHAGNDKLRLRKLFPKHGHERDRTAFAHIGQRRAEDSLRGACQRLLEPGR